jgi:ribosomal protein S18 acetylase RimI-like enzyme
MSRPTSSLPWDSELFGYPVARLNERHVDAKVLANAFDWCAARAVRCLYYLAAADDAPSLVAAQAAGFQFVDVRLTLARPLTPGQAWTVGAEISPATETDRAGLMALAPYLARVSRFSADPRFGREAAVRLYQAWLRKEAGAVLVARAPQGVGGCILCDVEPDGTGVISLLAVAPENGGQGLGVALCAAGLNWFVGQGCAQARVVTQGHNVASQRVYQRAGFVTQSVEIWFHKWFDTT